MLLELGLCGFRVFAAIDLMGCTVNACVAEIDPYTGACPGVEISRQQRDGGKFFVEILVDNRRFVDDSFAVDEDGNFGVGIYFKKIFRFVFEIDFNEFVRKIFFRQDNPCPVCVGSSKA